MNKIFFTVKLKEEAVISIKILNTWVGFDKAVQECTGSEEACCSVIRWIENKEAAHNGKQGMQTTYPND